MRKAITARPSRSPSAQDRPFRMRRRYEKAQDTMAHNVERGTRDALISAPCTCQRVVGSAEFRLVIPCKRHSKLRFSLRG